MNAIVKRSDRFTEADIDSEIVIMRLDSGEFFSLSGTGAEIWRLIDGTRDRAALRLALSDQFLGDESAIPADIEEFLSHLKEMGLLAD